MQTHQVGKEYQDPQHFDLQKPDRFINIWWSNMKSKYTKLQT